MNDEERTPEEEQQNGGDAAEQESGGDSEPQSTGPANNTWILGIFLIATIGLITLGFTSNRSPDISSVNATPTPMETGNPVYLHSAVDMGAGKVKSYQWDFGDGATQSGSDLRAVSHTYSSSGDYTITLKVTSERGAHKEETTLVTVEDQLDAVGPTVRSLNAVPRNGNYPLEVSFQASAEGNSAPVESYQWDFQSDGEVDRETSGPSTSYTYEKPGEGRPPRFYDVTLTVVDEDGNSSQASIGINTTP